MKTLFFLLFIFFFGGFCNCQEVLYKPESLKIIASYNSKNKILLNKNNDLLASIGNIILYKRNSEYYISHDIDDRIEELKLLNSEESLEGKIVNLEVFEMNNGDKLLLLKTYLESNNTSSAWGVRFENYKFCIILNLTRRLKIFDEIIAEESFEEVYKYSGNIENQNLTQKELDELIRTRTVKTINDFHYHYDIKLNKKEVLTIVKVDSKSETNTIKSGNFSFQNGLFTRIK